LRQLSEWLGGQLAFLVGISRVLCLYTDADADDDGNDDNDNDEMEE
jgi:hypothetical protein